MRTYTIILLAMLTALAVGCRDLKGPFNVVPRIAAHEKAVAGIRTDVSDGADVVESNTKQIEQKLSPEQRALVQAQIDAIKDACLKKLRVAGVKLGLLQDDLADTKVQVAGLEKENSKLAKDLVTANSKGKQFFYAAMSAMAVLGAGCLAFGVILFLTGNKKGMTIALTGVAITVVALVIGQYTVYFLIGGLLLLLVLTGLTVAEIKKREREVVEEKKKGDDRAVELVNSVEMLKDFVPDEVKPELFGAHDNDPGKIADVQSKSTQDYVKELRKGTKVRTVTAKSVLGDVERYGSGS
jgi:hypothetical protein